MASIENTNPNSYRQNQPDPDNVVTLSIRETSTQAPTLIDRIIGGDRDTINQRTTLSASKSQP